MLWAKIHAARLPELRMLFAIPNGGSRHMLEAVALKRSGVKSGVPDLCLPVPRRGFTGLWIELKAKRGRVSEEQAQWAKALNAEGALAVVCDGHEAAQERIEWYLS